VKKIKGQFMAKSFEKIFEGTDIKYCGVDYNHSVSGEYYYFKFRVGVPAGLITVMRNKIVRQFEIVGLTLRPNK